MDIVEDNQEWWERASVDEDNYKEVLFGLGDDVEAYVTVDQDCVVVGLDGESQVLISSEKDLEEFIVTVRRAWKAHEYLYTESLS